MSKLPYVRPNDRNQDPSLIPLDSLRAPPRHFEPRRVDSNDSTASNVAPPAHYVHAHNIDDPHYFEGIEPGLEGESSHVQPRHAGGGGDHKGTVQYDTLVDKDKRPELIEKHNHDALKSKTGEHGSHHHHRESDGESSGEETDDFDWDTDDSDDDDESRVVHKDGRVVKTRAKRGKRIFMWFMRLARPVRILLFGLIGTAIAMVPFIVTTTTFLDSPARPHVQSWSAWIAIIWASACGTFLILDWFPPIVLKIGVAFYGRAPPMFKTYVEVFIAILLWIKLTLCIAWAWISLGGILAITFIGQSNPPYFKYVFLVIKALFASGIILTAEKFAVQLIAINFHKVSLKDRLDTNQSALRALDRLADSKYLASGTNSRRATGIFTRSFGFASGSRPVSPGANASLGHHKNASQGGGYFGNAAEGVNGTPNNNRSSSPRNKKDNQTPKEFNEKEMRKGNFAAQLTDALQTATMKDSKLYRNRRMLSARRLAKKLFNAVGHHRPSLVAEDFEPFFDTQEEAREAFKHFDFDGNGDITRQEFRDGVQRIFRERRSLATSLKDASSAVGKLDGVLCGIALIIMIFIWLLIFNGDNTVANIAPLSTFVVGFSFIFGNSAKTLFESMIFIFATHPYDVGDLVCVDEQFMFVQEFGLISTTFRTTTNETIVAPNALLSSSKLIFNCRRSNNQWEVTFIQVGYDTTLLEMIDELRTRMRAYVKENDREWGGGLEINLNEFQTNANSIELVVAMEHKGNWQNWGERWTRRTQLMRHLKTQLEDLDIIYTLPKQPVSYAQRPGQAPSTARGFRMSSNAAGIPRSTSGQPLPVGGIGNLQLDRDGRLAAAAAAAKK